MAFLFDDLKYNKPYKKQIFLPYNKADKKKGSVVFLMTKSIEESLELMNLPKWFLNYNMFNSYYMEKDINLIINESSIYDIDREPILEEVNLSKYHRYTTDNVYEIKARTGKDYIGGETLIEFRDPMGNHKTVAFIVIRNNVLLQAYSITPELDKEIIEFVVEVVKCGTSHRDLSEKYKKILKDDYDFTFMKNGMGTIHRIDSFFEGAILTESMGAIDIEIAMWKAQAKVINVILKHYDDETWMRANYKKMKSKLNAIPLPGFKTEIKDTKESLKRYLRDIESTISYMVEMKTFELKEEYDIKDIVAKYNSWVKSTNTSTQFKLKCIRESRKAYEDTIELYELNIKRYEAETAIGKRIDNLAAIVEKVFSSFSFLTSGPLGIFKSIVIKSILPKSSRKNVLSVAEMEAKIEAYQKIVEELSAMEADIRMEGVKESFVSNNEVLLESPLTSQQRKNLSDSQYGLPKKRAYPMPDKHHVKLAIQMFNHVEKEDEQTLATNIKKKIIEFKMENEVKFSPKNRFSKYYESKEVHFKAHVESGEVSLTENYICSTDSITFFESEIPTILEDASFNKSIRRVLYSERIRAQKDILLRYKTVKNQLTFIKYTYLELDKYKQKNLFVDLQHYMNAFVKNNYMKLDKGINLFFELINRFIGDKRFDNHGYTRKTVFIPLLDWVPEEAVDIFDYKVNLNPVSIIYRLVYHDQIEKMRKAWSNIDFVFIAKNGYMKFNVNHFEKKNLILFRKNIMKLLNNELIEEDDVATNASKEAIVADVINSIEIASTGSQDETPTVVIRNLTGKDEKATPKQIKERIDSAEVSSSDEGMDKEKSKRKKEKEKELVKKIEVAASDAKDTEAAIDNIKNDEEVKRIIEDIKMSSPNSVDYSPTRLSRMNTLNDKYLSTAYKNTTIGEIVKQSNKPIKKTAVPIDSTNEEWQQMQGVNLDDTYDENEDIFNVLHHFSQCTVPVAIRDIKYENTTTSEDAINTWTVACEDINGKRFTLKFDVPRVVNKRYMRLRGNDKVIGIQLMNLPVIKTAQHTVQITTNYNKIFIEPKNTTTGKSIVTADRLIKAVNKYEGKDVTFVSGDNSLICRKYELPIDYIDLSSEFTTISYKDKDKTFTFYFNHDNIQTEYKALIEKDKKEALPIGVEHDNKTKRDTIIYAENALPVSLIISNFLCLNSEKFAEVYNATSVSSKYTYSNASIMNANIPLIVLMGYHLGLLPALDAANIKYRVEDKKVRIDKNTEDVIKMSDAYIVYDLTYDSSLLLNGLKNCNLEEYSIKESNNRNMWLDVLDIFGGRLISDGLDMFYDLMMDPITVNVCIDYRLPAKYIDALVYANMLLSDNKYNNHTDITGNRFRHNEIIAGYTYKALCNSYSQYRRSLKVGREVPMTIKQSAVIDLIMTDSTESDYSTLSPLLEFESANGVSFKGLSGMNAERAYGVDKRTYDKSMVNVLAMSTGFAGNAGVNRQSVIDPNIESTRGYIKSNPDDLSITKTFCMTEALTPYGVTSDDPFRTAMTFIQTAKHSMPTTIGDPALVTTGADQALVYLTSDTFSYKAKGKGKIKEKTEEYMVIEYDKPLPNGSKTEVVDLREKMTKNSDGGFYQVLKLDTEYKVGDTVRENDVIAVDKLSYTDNVGPRSAYSYNIGTFCKFAVIMSDDGFEDSCRTTQWLSKAMSSEIVSEHQYNFNKDTNIYYICKKGDKVQEGQPILIFQNAFEDEDANALVRALKADNNDVVEELGRITLKSKVTGTVKNVTIRRCVEIKDCSPTMQKVIKDYEKSVGDINKAFAKYDQDKFKSADPTYKLEATGKLKNSEDSVLITIYISYQDDLGISDKVVCYSALKGVSSKAIIPEGKEAFSAFRPDEKIHYVQGEIGDMGRMVGSIFKIGALNKVLVETQRAMCDIMGIKWKYFDED